MFIFKLAISSFQVILFSHFNIISISTIHILGVIFLLVKSLKLNFIKKLLFFSLVIILGGLILCFSFFISNKKASSLENIFNSDVNSENFLNQISNISVEEIADDAKKDSKYYIKWVDFKASASVLTKLANLDISSHNDPNSNVKYNWIELMAFLGTKYGGDLSKFNQTDLDKLTKEVQAGKSVSELASNMKLYNYFYEGYDAIFHEFIGTFEVASKDENGNVSYTTKYGLKAFLPIAKNYSFSHYKDFGSSRSYGYKRVHLGNDLLRKHWNSYYCRRIWLC